MDAHQKQIAIWLALPLLALLVLLSFAGGFTGLGFVLPVVLAIAAVVGLYFFVTSRANKDEDH